MEGVTLALLFRGHCSHPYMVPLYFRAPYSPGCQRILPNCAIGTRLLSLLLSVLSVPLLTSGTRYVLVETLHSVNNAQSTALIGEEAVKYHRQLLSTHAHGAGTKISSVYLRDRQSTFPLQHKLTAGRRSRENRDMGSKSDLLLAGFFVPHIHG